MNIQFDRYSLIIDGRRVFIRSGAMHYFRLPHPDLWEDRLRKLKAGGYNAVDLYFNWDYHSKAPGQYDFSGCRDVGRLLDLVESLGLYLIARPGPYINAETTRGGLPGWLLTQPGVILRNRDEGNYQYSPEYMRFVREWFDQILPFIKGRPNLLMVQVENEYSTSGMEPGYMEELIAIIRGHGIDVPTMHNDFYAAGLYADLVDIYAIDNYSVTDYEWDWRNFPELFSVLDNLEASIRPTYCQNRPLMMAELQAGWFVGWKGGSYDKIWKKLGREHIGIVTRSFLAQGGTIFNHYKAMGGTNWDHIGATDAYTSYDFSAPIAESGLPTSRYYEAKNINLLLSHFDWTQTDRIDPSELELPPLPSLYAARRDPSGAVWLILRNLTQSPQRNEIRPGVVAELAPHQMACIPMAISLKTGWELLAINVEPLAQTPYGLFLPACTPVTMLLNTAPTQMESSDPGRLQVHENTDGFCLVELTDPLSPDDVAWLRLNGKLILFLGADMADRLWQVGEGEYVIGPDMIRSPDEAFLATARTCWRVNNGGELQKTMASGIEPLRLPALESWQFFTGSSDWKGVPRDQLTAGWQNYRPITPEGAHMDSNGIHQGAVWYQYWFDGPAQHLTLLAQHIWSVYLNGHCLIASHTFHVHPETLMPSDELTIQLPAEYLNPDGANCLTVFVESLGHHKGFYEDTRDPRGILKLELDGQDIATSGWIRPEFLNPATGGGEVMPGQYYPIAYARTEFDLSIPNTVAAPVGLALDLDVERADIYLNGLLVGKYWRACQGQRLFYLPEGILNREGKNRLEMTLINFLPPLEIPEKFSKLSDRALLNAYQQLIKFSFRTADTALVTP